MIFMQKTVSLAAQLRALYVEYKGCCVLSKAAQNRGNCGVIGVSVGAICIFCAKSVQYRHHHHRERL